MKNDVDFESIYKTIGYSFKDNSLLQAALTHPSSCYNKNIKCENYQKLELLGDAVLSLIVLEMLINQYPDLDEGEIAKRKASLVCTESISKIARKLNIGDFIIMSHGEETTGGRNNNNTLEDVLEAIIGAIYFDAGLDFAKNFINKNWIEEVLDKENFKGDPKTRLQQWTQKYRSTLPTYTVVGTEEIDNSLVFEIEVFIDDDLPKFKSKHTTKKGSEIKCAIKIIKYIKDNIDENI